MKVNQSLKNQIKLFIEIAIVLGAVYIIVRTIIIMN